jgi:flagella basal body P-ring formation protein FlgA
MKLKIIFFLLLKIASTVMAQEANSPELTCNLEFFSKVYRLETNQNLSNEDIVFKSNCSVLILNKISQLISTSSGTVGTDFIKREIAKEFKNQKIEITPRKLTLLDFNSSLKEQLTNNSNLFFLNTKSLNTLKSISLLDGEQLKASCDSCNNYGEKNIKVDIFRPTESKSRALWFSSTVMAKVKVYKAKRNLSYQQKSLEEVDFYIDEIFSSTPDNSLTSLNNIQFFKTNKNILQGSVVSNLDLQPVNLINYGTPVNVTLKNQNINLQRTAMPARSAFFGEVIELRNPNNNKIIAGKVVDFNKVVIEL